MGGVSVTPLSQTILQQYQVRKTKKQKDAFIQLMKSHFPKLTVQEGGFPKCRNLIVGDIDSAKIILSAHYDTCAQLLLPNFITPKSPLLSILYSVLLVAPLVLIVILLNTLLNHITSNYWVHYWLSLAAYLGLMLLLVAGPANKHTANDNTSGVIALCELLQVLTPETRNKVAFVFFDHEETGLVGSSLLRSKHKDLAKGKLLINLDCISDGDHILVSATKAARKEYSDALKNAFQPTDNKSILFTKAERTYYPSDQVGFKKSVAIAALKKKRFIGYYMDRIHTSRDVMFDKENIKLVCSCIHRLLEKL